MKPNGFWKYYDSNEVWKEEELVVWLFDILHNLQISHELNKGTTGQIRLARVWYHWKAHGKYIPYGTRYIDKFKIFQSQATNEKNTGTGILTNKHVLERRTWTKVRKILTALSKPRNHGLWIRIRINLALLDPDPDWDYGSNPRNEDTD